MATLEKIRNKAGLLVIVVGLALFAFIIGDFLNSGSTFFRQKQEVVADVDGTPISIQDYQARVDEMIEVYKMQSGNSNLPDEYAAQIRQSVYDALIQEVVVDKELDKIGIIVSPEELFDMVQGENISPLIQQMPMFVNPQTGVFDKSALLNFLKTIENENVASLPADQQSELLKAKNFWLFWEKNIKRQRLEQKYTTLLGKAVVANKLDAKDAFDSSVENSDIVFAMQPYSSIPDSTIEVKKSELEKLYDQRKERFKQEEAKVIKYLAVDIRPSQEDYDNASEEVGKVRQELIEATGNHVADIVNESSDMPFVDAYVSPKLFDEQLERFATTAEVGTVNEPIFENDQYRLFKLIDKKIAPDSVKVSHIMLAHNRNEAGMAKLADSLINVLKGGAKFADIAREFSADQSAEKGGELGWFTELTAVRGLNEDFKNAIFNSPVNQPTVIKSTYGTHIVNVDERTANITKYKVADVEIKVSPSSKTYSAIYNDLNQFVAKNNKIDKLDEAAKEAGYAVVSDVKVTAADQIVGSIKNSRPVIRWAFQNDKGKLSEIFECDSKFVVAAVQGTLPKGYRSLASVEPELKAELLAQKKGEKIVADLKAKKLTSLEAYAEAMGSKIDSVRFINFNTTRITQVGVEPKMNAAVTLAPLNQLTGPVQGNNGVYAFIVNNRTKEAKEYNEAEQIRVLEANSSYRIGYQSIQYLISKAKIEDNRIRFY